MQNQDTKTVNCKICGQVFNVNKTACGIFSRRTICDACSSNKEQTKDLICQKCGKIFKVGRTPSGGFSVKKFCPDCDISQKLEKDVTCQSCGKIFKVGRGSNGAFLKRKFCDECYKQKYQAEYILKNCNVCGKEFKIYRNEKGYFNKNKVRCDTCAQKQDNQVEKILVCQKCGKEFKVGRAANGNFLDHRKYCDSCNKSVDYKEYMCEYCNKFFRVYRNDVKNIYAKVKYCCAEHEYNAAKEKRKQTMQQRYNVDYLFQLYNNNSESKINFEFAELLSNNNISFTQEYQINDYIYDFYLPNLDVLLEINPTYTHSPYGTHFNNWVYDSKYEHYHLDKSNNTNKRVIHVWQWDDWNKIVQLVQSKQNLYARKLILKDVPKREANTFLNKYHIQDSCRGNIVNMGLYQDEELVQVMTFGKPRYNKNYQWELLRLCSHMSYTIVGGAEKIFKHFINSNYYPESVISYCDASKFTGDVYKHLGFILKEQTKPAKIWSKESNRSKEHITDNLLRQRGFDQLFGTNYGKGTSNEELIEQEGYRPVYDCGQKVFIWHK